VFGLVYWYFSSKWLSRFIIYFHCSHLAHIITTDCTHANQALPFLLLAIVVHDLPFMFGVELLSLDDIDVVHSR